MLCSISYDISDQCKHMILFARIRKLVISTQRTEAHQTAVNIGFSTSGEDIVNGHFFGWSHAHITEADRSTVMCDIRCCGGIWKKDNLSGRQTLLFAAFKRLITHQRWLFCVMKIWLWSSYRCYSSYMAVQSKKSESAFRLESYFHLRSKAASHSQPVVVFVHRNIYQSVLYFLLGVVEDMGTYQAKWLEDDHTSHQQEKEAKGNRFQSLVPCSSQ